MCPLNLAPCRSFVTLARANIVQWWENRLRMADEEVLADSVGNAFKKLGYDEKWNRVGASKDDGIKGGF